MPVVFQLTRIGSSTPSLLHDVDRAICQSLELPFSDEHWVAQWYDTIGLALACGHSWDWMLENFTSPTKRRIIHFLRENYTTDSWREWK